MLEKMLLGIGVMLILYGLYKWITKNFDYFERIGVDYIKPQFIFGSIITNSFNRLRSDLYFIDLYNKCPSAKIFGFFSLRTVYFCVRDPEVIKQLTVKDFDYFEDHSIIFDEKSDVILGNILTMLRGEKWRQMRATLSPAFTSSKMRQMFELVTETANDMSSYLQTKVAKGKAHNYEMKDIFSKFTNDVIASTAFGIKVNSFENDKNVFFITGKKYLDNSSKKCILKILLIKYMPNLMRFLDIPVISKNVTRFFREMVTTNIQTREKEGISRPDMINIIMQIKKGAFKQQSTLQETKSDLPDIQAAHEFSDKRVINRDWSDNELIAQCLLFFTAGFETSSTLLSFASYELALNPDIQDKLYKEIVETERKCTGQRVSYDLLQNMKYMDQVISEILRKWPPVPLTDRLCVRDYDYNDGVNKFTIYKGQPVWIPIIALHRSPQYFPDPEKFDPERFNDENKNEIVSGTYIPFGLGPRNCIASRFALMEVKAVLFYLLLNFKFLPNEKTQIPLKLKKLPGSMASESGIYLELKARTQDI